MITFLKSFRFVGFFLLLLFTWAIDVYTCSVYHVPGDPVENADPHSETASWIPKSKFGINQLILKGTPYGRGYGAGQKTSTLIFEQEQTLVSQLNRIFPNAILRRLFEVFTIRWFLGSEKYFEPWMLEEMDGVSRWTSPQFDYLGNPLTRQVAYHGLHEVGQMMVDQESDSMGCTVVGVPDRKAWIIGRNFDFEGGRIFDSEKIMKWVYPDKGNAFLSVIWAGMVGAVTGVNEKGVYISLNAAGSRDFRRTGTPSTLVITKALMEANSAVEAVEIIKNETMFITDIFVVSDRTSGKAYRIEKSPLATEVIPLNGTFAVTNHLTSPRWANDSINQFRTFELTSNTRATRAEKLLSVLKTNKPKNTKDLELSILKILRDKGEDQGKPLQLGNRKAIDALIATHSVIYNENENIIYVSQGLGLSGAFTGFDLNKSFTAHKPISVGELPADPMVSNETFKLVRFSHQEISRAEDLIKKKKCVEAGAILKNLESKIYLPYNFYLARGNEYKCNGDLASAKKSWQKALDMSPAYPRQVRYLKEALK